MVMSSKTAPARLKAAGSASSGVGSVVAEGWNTQVIGAVLAAIHPQETVGQTCALHVNLTAEEPPGTDLEFQLTGPHPHLVVVTQFEARDLQGAGEQVQMHLIDLGTPRQGRMQDFLGVVAYQRHAGKMYGQDQKQGTEQDDDQTSGQFRG